VHNSLIFQLERELTRHRSEVRDHDTTSKWIDRWSEKRQKLKELKKEKLDLSMDLRELKKIKLQLTESFL